MELQAGGSRLGTWLATGPDQGRRACQPRSVLDQLCAVRAKYKCPGVGRRETHLQRDRDAAVQGDGDEIATVQGDAPQDGQEAEGEGARAPRRVIQHNRGGVEHHPSTAACPWAGMLQ